MNFSKSMKLRHAVFVAFILFGVMARAETNTVKTYWESVDWTNLTAQAHSSFVAFSAAIEAQEEMFRWKDGTTNQHDIESTAKLENEYGIVPGVSTDKRIPVGSYWVCISFLTQPKEKPVIPHFFGLSQVVGVSTGGVEVIALNAWPAVGHAPPRAFHYFNQTSRPHKHDGVEMFLKNNDRVFPQFYPQK